MRIRKPKKDRQRNSQKKTDKRTNSDPHSKLKIDPNKNWRVSSSCSTSDARRATLVPYSCAPNRVNLCAEKESIYAPLDNMEFHRQLQKYHVYQELNISISSSDIIKYTDKVETVKPNQCEYGSVKKMGQYCFQLRTKNIQTTCERHVLRRNQYLLATWNPQTTRERHVLRRGQYLLASRSPQTTGERHGVRRNQYLFLL